jgi:anti-anti-sigma regulatory factor
MQATSMGRDEWRAAGHRGWALDVCEQDDPDGSLRVVALGEIDIAVSDELLFQLRRLVRVRPHVRLDLSRVGFIDGSAMAAIVKTVIEARGDGWGVEVGRDLGPTVERVVALTGVGPVLWPEEPFPRSQPAVTG